MEKVAASIANLRTLDKKHTDMGMRILQAAKGAIYHFDFIAIPVLNRSECLLAGFCDLVEKRNFICAAPLIRLQLDNLLRFQAGWLVKDPRDFALRVFRGEKISNLKDKDDYLMKDWYLVDKMSIQYPEIKSVYEHTSGYIHLSDKHIFNSLGSKAKEGEFNMKVGSTDSFISEDEYLSSIQAFFQITGILFSYLEGWAVSKSRSETIKEED